MVGGEGWENLNLAKERIKARVERLQPPKINNKEGKKAIRVVGVGWLVEVLQPSENLILGKIKPRFKDIWYTIHQVPKKAETLIITRFFLTSNNKHYVNL